MHLRVLGHTTRDKNNANLIHFLQLFVIFISK
jgi:hypothetical protein